MTEKEDKPYVPKYKGARERAGGSGGSPPAGSGAEPRLDRDDEPYVPEYSGFDIEAQKRAQETVERAKETEGAKGEDANKEYVDEGPKEYRRRKGEDA